MNIKYDFLKIDSNSSSRDQFNFIKNTLPWGEEQIQADLFFSVLPTITTKKPVMIELGSGGVGDGKAQDCSQYSILFEKWFDYNCTNICTEVRKELIEAVATDWKNIHLVNAKCYHGYNGAWKGWQWCLGPGDARRLYVKDLLEENNIKKVDILHVDIQGSEMSLCEELSEQNLFQNIRYIFMSIHEGCDGRRIFSRQETLEYCKEQIEKSINVKCLFEDANKGGWGDGLLVVENTNF
jgi:hypothetical protein